MTTATEILRFSPALEQIRCDALRYCDKRGLLEDRHLQEAMAAMAHKAFRNAVEPYIKAKVDLMACGIGMVRVHADGTIEHVPEPLQPEAKKLWDQLDEMIANEAARYKLPD
jgi:hypothetical protein